MQRILSVFIVAALGFVSLTSLAAGVVVDTERREREVVVDQSIPKSGVIWNSVNVGLKSHVYLLFSDKIENGRYARLKIAKEGASNENFLVRLVSQSNGNQNYKVKPAIFLDTVSGNIVTSKGQVVGFTRLEGFPYITRRKYDGYRFDKSLITINERTFEISFDVE